MRDLVLTCSGEWTLSITRQSAGVCGCHLKLALTRRMISSARYSMEALGVRMGVVAAMPTWENSSLCSTVPFKHNSLLNKGFNLE